MRSAQRRVGDVAREVGELRLRELASRGRVALALLLTALTAPAACSTRAPQSLHAPPTVSVASLRAAHEARVRNVHALRARARVSLNTAQGESFTRQQLLVARPNRLRVSVSGLLGQPLHAVATDGEWLDRFDARAGLASAPLADAELASWLGLPLTPRDLVEWLLATPRWPPSETPTLTPHNADGDAGDGGAGDGDGGGAVGDGGDGDGDGGGDGGDGDAGGDDAGAGDEGGDAGDGGDGADAGDADDAAVTAAAPAGWVLRFDCCVLWFDRAGFLRAFERAASGAQPGFRVSYKDWRARPGGAFPFWLRFESPLSGARTQLTLTLREVEANPALAPGVFRLAPREAKRSGLGSPDAAPAPAE